MISTKELIQYFAPATHPLKFYEEKLVLSGKKYPHSHPTNGKQQGGYHYFMGDSIAIEVEFGKRLSNEIAASKPAQIVEVGTAHGYSAAWILLGMMRAGGGNFTTFDKQRLPWHFYDIPGECKAYIMDFKDTSEELPEKIDFVFHDASHTFELVRRDMEVLLPRMAQKGKIWIHDALDEVSIPLKDFFYDEGWSYVWLKEASHLGFACRFGEKWSSLF